MGRARAVVLTPGLAGLVAALTPVWLVHHAGSRLLTSRRRPSSGPIVVPRRRPAEVSVTSLLTSRSPVIVEGLADQLGVTDVATPQALVARAGDDELSVTFHDASMPYFLYSGGYGAVVRKRTTMTVAEFVTMMFGDGPEPGTVVYQLLGQRSLGGKVGAVLDEFDVALRARGARTEARFSGVWIGSTGAVTPLHHDAWPGLLFQVHGRKRVAMYGPRDRSNLYFRSPLHGAGRWSQLPGRSADADPTEFNRLALAKRFESELRPGDALYIPPFWGHEMEALEPNVSVPFRFAGQPSTYLNPGFLRPASELLRKQVAAASGRG